MMINLLKKNFKNVLYLSLVFIGIICITYFNINNKNTIHNIQYIDNYSKFHTLINKNSFDIDKEKNIFSKNTKQKSLYESSKIIKYKVKKGDTFEKILANLNINKQNSLSFINNIKIHYKDLLKLSEGQDLYFNIVPIAPSIPEIAGLNNNNKKHHQNGYEKQEFEILFFHIYINDMFYNLVKISDNNFVIEMKPN